MGDKTKIQWTDATWNPVRGCSVVAPECERCYAMGVAARFSGPGLAYEGLAKRSEKRGLPQWTGEVRFVTEILDQPLRWAKPRRIFTNSMSDLFHEKLSNQEIAAVFGVMAAAPRHTFQVLTKRPARALEWFGWVGAARDGAAVACLSETLICGRMRPAQVAEVHGCRARASTPWPLPNVHLYVSAGTQKSADEFVPILFKIPAAVRGVSAEPLLERVDLSPYVKDDLHEMGRAPRIALDHVIVGGESGHGARRFHLEWARQIVRDCKAANVPVFVKQFGANAVDSLGASDAYEIEVWSRTKKGDDPSEWPEELRVREVPR